MWTCTEWLLIAQILSGQRQKTTKIWKFISGTYARKSLLKVSKKVFQLNSVTFDEQHKPLRGNWSGVAAGMHWFMTAFHMPLVLGEHRGKVSVLVFKGWFLFHRKFRKLICQTYFLSLFSFDPFIADSDSVCICTVCSQPPRQGFI